MKVFVGYILVLDLLSTIEACAWYVASFARRKATHGAQLIVFRPYHVLVVNWVSPSLCFCWV
jgi:hypothetical protein